MTAKETTFELVGDIDESGLLANLSRKGFNHVKCLCELHANSVDANACHIIYDISSETIKIIDDGKGMAHFEKMFSLNRANHTNEMALGVSGIGAKAALSILSQHTQVSIFTRCENGEHLCATVPWDKMHESGKYTKMIEIRKMTVSEIENFNKDRIDFGRTTGTTIRFFHNSALENAIKLNFKEKKEEEKKEEAVPSILPQDRLSNIYGKFHNTKVMYRHYADEPSTLPLYDYFEGDDNEFYTGKRTDTITVYKNKNKNKNKEEESEPWFIWRNTLENVDYEICRIGRGWSKTPSKVKVYVTESECIGKFVVVTGHRKDDNYFCPASTELPKADVIMNPYDTEHGLNRANFDYLCKPKILRNSQVIGVMDLPGLSSASTRANGVLMHKIHHVRCEINYSTLSSQNNEMDGIVGTQENKIQLICNIPDQMVRLIKQIKEDKHAEIWSSFINIVDGNTIPQPVSEPVVVVEEPVIKVEEPIVVEEPVIKVEEPVIKVEEPVIVVITSPVINDDITEPHVVPVIATEHLTITVATGKCLLNQWNNSQVDSDVLDKIIIEMIYKYQSKCTQDQVDDFLQVMDKNCRFTVVMNIIGKRYPENQQNKEMLLGSELYRLYILSFPNTNLQL